MKKVFGFKVNINEQEMCRAGFQEANSVITCILDSIRRKNDNTEELNISVTGLNSDTHQHVDWFRESLHLGDKVTIEIISTDFDTPSSVREPKSEKEILARKIEYFNKLKLELKDHI